MSYRALAYRIAELRLDSDGHRDVMLYAAIRSEGQTAAGFLASRELLVELLMRCDIA